MFPAKTFNQDDVQMIIQCDYSFRYPFFSDKLTGDVYTFSKA